MNIIFTPAARAAGSRGQPTEFIVREAGAKGMRLGMVQYSPEAKGWRPRVFSPREERSVITLPHCRTSLDAAAMIGAFHGGGKHVSVTYVAPIDSKPAEGKGAP